MIETPTAESGEVQWIRCPGCSGQIGIPPAWPAEAVCCPKCAAVVHIDDRMRVLWRPTGEEPADTPLSKRAEWIACHGCSGEIGVPPDWLGPTIACPKCGAIVAMRETGRVLWRPPEATESAAQVTVRSTSTATSPPAETGWKKPAAIVLLTLGILGFFSTAVTQGHGKAGIGLVAGLLNPLFFIGVPLGWYWLRASQREPPRNTAARRPNVASSVSSVAARVVSPSIPSPLAVPPAVTSSSKSEGIDERLAGYGSRVKAPTTKRSNSESIDGATVAVWAVVVLSLVLFACFVGFIVSEKQRGDLSSSDHPTAANDPAPLRAPRTQSEALAEILRCGGRAMVRGEGDKLRIVMVSFQDSKLRDDQLTCLTGLEDLAALDLSNTPITDAGVSVLEDLMVTDLIKLRLVSLSGTRASRLPELPPNVIAASPPELRARSRFEASIASGDAHWVISPDDDTLEANILRRIADARQEQPAQPRSDSGPTLTPVRTSNGPRGDQPPSGTGEASSGRSRITVPISVYLARHFPSRRLVSVNVTYALEFYEALHGSKPATEDEFMKQVIEANAIHLPALPQGHVYKYDAAKGELFVQQPEK